MNALIFLTKNDSEEVARMLIAIVKKSNAESIKILATDKKEWFNQLPVEEVIYLKGSVAALGENYINAIEKYVWLFSITFICMQSCDLGIELTARLGYRMHGSSASHVTAAIMDKFGLLIQRRTFGFHMQCEIELKKAPFFIAVESGSEPGIKEIGSPRVFQDADCGTVYFKRCKTFLQDTETGIETYRKVMCIGRGVGSARSAEKIETLGACLGFGVGASRPPVLNCWEPLDKLIGLSGTMIAPDVLITFGVSGCTAFMKGVEKSKIIIAIDSDSEATIFKHCDVGIVEDCNAIVEYLFEIKDEQ